jgi:hypothetical protein
VGPGYRWPLQCRHLPHCLREPLCLLCHRRWWGDFGGCPLHSGQHARQQRATRRGSLRLEHPPRCVWASVPSLALGQWEYGAFTASNKFTDYGIALADSTNAVMTFMLHDQGNAGGGTEGRGVGRSLLSRLQVPWTTLRALTSVVVSLSPSRSSPQRSSSLRPYVLVGRRSSRSIVYRIRYRSIR